MSLTHNIFQGTVKECLGLIAYNLDLETAVNPIRHDYQIPSVLHVDFFRPYRVGISYTPRLEIREFLPPPFYIRSNGRVTEYRMGAAVARSVLVDLTTTGYDTSDLIMAANDDWCSPSRRLVASHIDTQLDLAETIGHADRIHSHEDIPDPVNIW